MAHDEERGRGLPHERLERLAGRDVEVVRRLVEQEEVGGHDAEDRQLQPRPLAAGEGANLLEDVVAPEQEAGQVPAGLAGRHRDLAEQGVEDGLADKGLVRTWAR